MSLILKLQSLSTRIGEEIKVLRSQKQDKLVSGTSIKTINGESLLGEGNLAVQGGGGGLGAPVPVTGVNGLHTMDASLGRYFKLNVPQVMEQIPYMKAPVIRTSWALNHSSYTSFSITLSGYAKEVGDIVLIGIGSDGALAALPSGWTNLGNVNSGTEYTRVFYRVVDGSFPSSVSISGVSTATCSVGFVIANPASAMLDVTPVPAVGATGMPDAPSITTITENCLILALGFLDDDNLGGSVTAPAGYTLHHAVQASGTGQTVMAASKVLETAGAEDPAIFGGSGNDEWVAWTIAFRSTPAVRDEEVPQTVQVVNTPANEVFEAVADVTCLSNLLSFPANWSWNYPVDFKENSGMQIRFISDNGGTTFKAIAPVTKNAFAPVLLEEYSKSLTVPAMDIDWKEGAIFHKTLTGYTQLTFSNLEQGKVITAIVNGNYTLSLPGNCKILSGEYDGSVTNYIQLMCVSSTVVLAVISQEQV